MKYTLIAILTIALFGCHSKKPNYSKGSSGTIVVIDSASLSKIKVIQFEKSKSVIFPSDYTENFFKTDTTISRFFTPDEETIRYINKNLAGSYCQMNYNFGRQWRDELQEKDYKQTYNNCQKNIKDLKKFDKQFMGYINSKGEKIIIVQLLDFRQDPYLLKNNLEVSFIYGWHDWFETNVHGMYFHLKDKKFTKNHDE